MPAFAPDQWRAVSPYLDQALDMVPEQRAAWLETIREQNPALAADLQTLLKEHRVLGGQAFLEAPGALPQVQLLVGQVVGAYTLESPIGRGGMGTVWLARRNDGRFEGRAAVKFLNLALLGGAAEERFKREGSFLARLAHPNIAHLIDAGVAAGGQPYLVLEYVEGTQIDRYCEDHALDLEARIRLFLDVMAAVAQAHANLIVHRDIKPSNVLVTGDGQVKLLDFGIAKLLEDQTPGAAPTALTREGERALTLAYAAPEQVKGDAVTTGTDVYALGVLLYLLLAGKHPAESALHSPADLIKAIVDTESPLPSGSVARTDKLRRALRGDLDTIVAKALKKDPAERYASVTAFAEDLRRYLRNQTISAKPDTLAYRTRKFVRRNRLSVALAAGVFLATVAGLVSTAIQSRKARMERDFALRQLSRAEAINDLNGFVNLEGSPSTQPLNDVLARAERVVERRQGNDANRIERLMAIGSRYTDQFEYVKARRVLEQAYALARALPDASTRARTSCALAVSITNQGDEERAERLIQEGLNELGDDASFSLDRVFCLSRGSFIARRRGHPNDAVSRAEAAQRALRQSTFRSEALELDNLINLATAYRQAGQVREAGAAFEQAAVQLASLGYDETVRGQILFTNWGTGLLAWGRPLDAERVLRRAIAPGKDNQPIGDVSAELLVDYARALKELGRLDDAADYARRAHEKAQALGNQRAIRESLLLQTAIYRGLGDLDRSAEVLLELEPVVRRIAGPGQVPLASLVLERALTTQARGDAQAALDLVNQAVGIVRERTGSLATLLLSRSDIQLQLHDKANAAEDARQALKILLSGTQPGMFSSKVGRAYVALGRALQAQDKQGEARAAFRSAAEHLQSALGPDHQETRAARQLAEPQLQL